MAFRVRMKIECVRGRRAGAERETSRREGVKYLKINAISNAQSDYIARGWQRCEGSDGFFFFFFFFFGTYKAVH